MADFNSEVKRTFNTIRDDIRTSHFGNAFRRESHEISEFYLTDEQRKRLDQMNSIQRAFHYTGWILQALFYKLTPFRRLVFVLGIVFLFSVHFQDNSRQFSTNGLLGGMLLVIVILLELKDKLLAHDELQEGRHIQEALMPEQIQQFEGWSIYLYTRSANEVCGDLVDFLRLEKSKAAVAIADVAGKGLHAALLTAKLQATMRALVFDAPSILTLVGKINTIFHRDSPSRMFASLVYAEIVEDNGDVSFVNAGHLPPLVVQNGAIREMAKGDLAIGLTRTVAYTERTLHLGSGDLLVLYSDGVTEAKNEHGDFFGKERLTAVLKRSTGSPEQIGRTIVAEVDRFMGQTRPSDDLSLIILRRS
jgi:phosphoserine phosphatase RsbU/P